MEMEKPVLSIVIVSYEVRDLLRNCLNSVRAASRDIPTEIWVVDNASGDGTPEMVRREFPEVQFIASPENVGFAAGNNIGLRRAAGEYVMLLNPDTLVFPDTLRTLVDAARIHGEALIGPRFVDAHGRWQRSYWAFPTPGWLTATVIGLPAFVHRHLAPPQLPVDAEQELRVDWLSGACILARKDTLKRLDWLCEDYFMYMEDIDLCRGAAQLSVPVLYHPHTTIVHYGGSSAAKLIERTGVVLWNTEEKKNHRTYIRRHHSSATRMGVRLAHVMSVITRPLLDGARRLRSPRPRAHSGG